jgi:hypothetical protein
MNEAETRAEYIDRGGVVFYERGSIYMRLTADEESSA